MSRTFLILTLAVGLCGLAAMGRTAAPTNEEAAVRSTLAAYGAAFHRKDAKALAELWSPQAGYVSPTNGKRLTGRDKIEAEFRSAFESDPQAKLSATIDSLRFITGDVATVDGKAKVAHTGAAASESTFTAILVKKDGKWLLDSVRETDLPAPPKAEEKLADLAWLVGEWEDEDEHARVHTRCQWTANRAFLTRSFTIAVEGRAHVEGTQIIGWDAAAGKVRSWAFDSDGGIAEGTWKRDGDRWVIETKHLMADGKKGASINIVRMVDDNHFGWQAVGREIDGELLPNVDEVLVVRTNTLSDARK